MIWIYTFDDGTEIKTTNPILSDELISLVSEFGKVTVDKQEKGVRRMKDTVNVIRCKNCAHFEYDSVAIVDGIPLIVAHEICKAWGKGCKTSEDGYCFMAIPREEQKERELPKASSDKLYKTESEK